MTAATTRMFQEAAEAPKCVQRQLDEDAGRVAVLAARLRQAPPRAVLTCARGSSDHAATYARYLIETQLGLLTSSASPSVSSVFGVRQDLSQCLFLAISQSGRSPDLLSAATAAKSSGAMVVALVNAEDSPLATIADHCLPLRAGVESSVAATKSYLCALAATLHLVAHWSGSEPLRRALGSAPAKLEEAWRLDWQSLVTTLVPVNHLYVIGRGLGLGIAQEAALKLKETCGMHAEAFSSAEVRHGPMAILGPDMPAVMFCQDDEALPGLVTLAEELAGEGIPVLAAGCRAKGVRELPTIAAHATVAPLLLAQSFYKAAAMLAVARGFDPDRPPRLQKVTHTL